VRGARIGFALAALLVVGCGSDAAGPGPTDASTKPTSTVTQRPPASVATTAAPPAIDSVSSPEKPGIEPSDAAVAKLLEGGEPLKSLPTRPVDSGAGFDPGLRGALAPQSPVADSKKK
jgi:hypothetical protein